MMSSRVALCIDGETAQNPALAGLEGESLAAQSWLQVFVCGEEARRQIAVNASIAEAWVVSSDDIEPINLAATLKQDRPDLRVRLVAFESCGSLYSRAHNAGIDEVANREVFLKRYASAKEKLATRAKPSVPLVPLQELRETHEPSGSLAHMEPLTPVAQQPVLTSQPPTSASQRLLVPKTSPSTKRANRSFIMPVVSGSGGAGKSTVAVLSAFIAQRMGFCTLLLDYDLQFGDAAMLAGVKDPLTIDEAMAHPERLVSNLPNGVAPALLAAPTRLEASDEVVRYMPQLLERLSADFDVIVANTGAAWADQHALLLERSSAALFLIDQRASSVRACKHALSLCARCGIASGPFQFAVNKCGKGAPLTSIDVSCALQGSPVFELRDGGRDVEDFLGAGAAVDLLDSRNELCTSLEQVLTHLVPGAAQRLGNRQLESGEQRAFRRRGHRSGRKWGRNAS